MGEYHLCQVHWKSRRPEPDVARCNRWVSITVQLILLGTITKFQYIGITSLHLCCHEPNGICVRLVNHHLNASHTHNLDLVLTKLV